VQKRRLFAHFTPTRQLLDPGGRPDQGSRTESSREERENLSVICSRPISPLGSSQVNHTWLV
jgi:hypothetical protein